MSASNWTTCPKCASVARARKEAQIEAVQAAYGVVPVEEFDKLRAAAAKDVCHE